MFERTWDVAVKLCRQGRVDGRHFSVGAGLYGTADSSSKGDGGQKPRWAIMSLDGRPIFTAPTEEEAEAGALFTVARRFVELEEAQQRGTSVPDYALEARRTFRDSLREWGLMDEGGRVLKAYDYDPEPLLGYVVRVGEVYAYGVVKQSALSEGTITPTGACDNPEEARRRASELLMLALVRGATVMGMNGVPAVIDLSADSEDEDAAP
jgi:hypothetical protein